MKYLKTQIKVLVVIFLGLSLMALVGEPINADSTKNVAMSTPHQAN